MATASAGEAAVSVDEWLIVDQGLEELPPGTSLEGNLDLASHMESLLKRSCGAIGTVYEIGTFKLIWRALDDKVKLKLQEAGFKLERPDQLAEMTTDETDSKAMATQLLGYTVPQQSCLPQHLWHLTHAAAAHVRQLGGHRVRALDKPTQYLEQIRRDVNRQCMRQSSQLQMAQVIKKGLPVPKRWITRRKRQLSRAGPDHLQRAEVEERERDRWVEKLEAVLKEARMPIWLTAKQCADPAAMLRHCAGRARAKTMRQRVRHWSRIMRWLRVAQPTLVRPDEAAIAEYLEMLFQEPCSRTVPQSVLEAIAFVEERGGLPKEERVSMSEVINSMVADMTLRLSTFAPLTKKAPQLLSSIIMALELYVEEEDKPKYKRCYAWTKLLRLWTAMRADDVQGLLPHTMVMQQRGLEAVLDRTKTSGPGRKIRWLNVFVAREAFLVSGTWLQTGYDLWQTPEMDFKRDYLVPVPEATMEAVSHKKAEYPDMAVMSQMLLSELGTPVFSYSLDSWSLDDSRPLLGTIGAKFYSEHSERNFVNSHAAVLGYDKQKRDMLGRWQPEQSDDYLRTTREVVSTIQRHVAEAIRMGDKRISEETALTGMTAHLADRLPDDEVTHMISVLNYKRYLRRGVGLGVVPLSASEVSVPEMG